MNSSYWLWIIFSNFVDFYTNFVSYIYIVFNKYRIMNLKSEMEIILLIQIQLFCFSLIQSYFSSSSLALRLFDLRLKPKCSFTTTLKILPQNASPYMVALVVKDSEANTNKMYHSCSYSKIHQNSLAIDNTSFIYDNRVNHAWEHDEIFQNKSHLEEKFSEDSVWMASLFILVAILITDPIRTINVCQSIQAAVQNQMSI